MVDHSAQVPYGAARERLALMGGPEAQQLAILTTFILRARRVAEHSLAKDTDLLTALANREFTLQRDAEDLFLIERRPPEEQLESAAARVRPLILQRESTYWSKVLNALGYFARDNAKAVEYIAEFRRAWRATSERDGAGSTYVQIRNPDGTETKRTSDLDLAYAYIYGDVIHHDEERLAGVKGFDIQHRFHEAAPLIGRMIALTVGTLNFTRHLIDTGVVPLSTELFTVDVVATETDMRRRARAYISDVGTEPPTSLDDDLAHGWTEFNPSVGSQSATPEDDE